MIADKRIFTLMIKYHSVIVKRLIEKNLVYKREEKLCIVNQNVLDSYSDYCPYRIVEVDKNNVTRIVASTYDIERLNKFVLINTNNPAIFKKLSTRVLRSNFDNTLYHYCIPSCLDYLLEKHHQDISYIKLSKQHKALIKGDSIPFYLKIIQKQIEKIIEYRDSKRNIENLSCQIVLYNYKGYSSYGRKWVEDVEKHREFAYLPLYSDIEWTQRLVEKYKDKIIWKRLIEDSNLQWTEDMVRRYSAYIPYNELDTFKAFDTMSNEFIETHINVLNWKVFLRTGKFEWSSSDLEHFHTIIDRKSFCFEDLADNKRFIWNDDLLRKAIKLNPYFLSCCIKKKELSDILFQIPNYVDLIQGVSCDPFIFLKLKDGGEKPFNTYSGYFTIEFMKKYHKKWEEVVSEKHDGMQRTPDTNYHFYKVYNRWDYFMYNNSIRLTYEISKYLYSITITLGGAYTLLDDGSYMEEDARNPKVNGLEAFNMHGIASIEDKMRICNDDELIEVFLNGKQGFNPEITDYLIENFFSDYSLDDYLNIINQLKDWDNIVKDKLYPARQWW